MNKEYNYVVKRCPTYKHWNQAKVVYVSTDNTYQDCKNWILTDGNMVEGYHYYIEKEVLK